MALDPDSDLLNADRDKLLQAIRNLADNAWKYTPPGGVVTISTQRTEDGIKTVFTNSGCGNCGRRYPLSVRTFFPRGSFAFPGCGGGGYRTGDCQGAD